MTAIPPCCGCLRYRYNPVVTPVSRAFAVTICAIPMSENDNPSPDHDESQLVDPASVRDVACDKVLLRAEVALRLGPTTSTEDDTAKERRTTKAISWALLSCYDWRYTAMLEPTAVIHLHLKSSSSPSLFPPITKKEKCFTVLWIRTTYLLFRTEDEYEARANLGSGPAI